MSKNVWILFVLIFFVTACNKKEDKKYIILNFKDNLNNHSTTIDGRQVVLTKFKLYISNIKFITNTDDTILIKDIDLYTLENNLQFKYQNTEHQNIKSLIFSIGLDSLQNSLIPSNFPDNHPLSLEQDMHWGMIKYRFLVAEGILDSSISKNQLPDFPVSLHLGRDELYRTLSFNLDNLSEGAITIMLNYNKMFERRDMILDPRNYFSIHSNLSEMIIANELMTNFAAGIEIYK